MSAVATGREELRWCWNSSRTLSLPRLRNMFTCPLRMLVKLVLPWSYGQFISIIECEPVDEIIPRLTCSDFAGLLGRGGYAPVWSAVNGSRICTEQQCSTERVSSRQ